MVDRSILLRKMRKHAKTFSSAISPSKVIDKASLNHALGLIDLFAKETNFGSLGRISIKIPPFLKALRQEKNLDFLRNEIDQNSNLRAIDFSLKNQRKKKKDKFKRAEIRLSKLLSTKDC
tara:strand:+ start:243 stop:602 length:360 start_codon:yes stop_codon:yes gene_type:complete